MWLFDNLCSVGLPEIYLFEMFLFNISSTFNVLDEVLINFFWKGPDSKYLTFWTARSLYSTLLLWLQSPHIQYVNKRTWLCSGKICCTKIGAGPHWAFGPDFASPSSRAYFSSVSFPLYFIPPKESNRSSCVSVASSHVPSVHYLNSGSYQWFRFLTLNILSVLLSIYY